MLQRQQDGKTQRTHTHIKNQPKSKSKSFSSNENERLSALSIEICSTTYSNVLAFQLGTLLNFDTCEICFVLRALYTYTHYTHIAPYEFTLRIYGLPF